MDAHDPPAAAALAGAGSQLVAEPLGVDEQGREVLSFLPGTVPRYPLPRWVWDDSVLVTAGRWLAMAHRASTDFDAADPVWQLPAHQPAEVICLNDVAPYNMVFDGEGQLSGWIDVDTVSPGPRVWDLASLAYRLGPVTGAPDTGAGPPDLPRLTQRLAVLCQTYAAAGDRVNIFPADVLEALVARLRELADFTDTRAALGNHYVTHHADARAGAALGEMADPMRELGARWSALM